MVGKIEYDSLDGFQSVTRTSPRTAVQAFPLANILTHEFNLSPGTILKLIQKERSESCTTRLLAACCCR